MSLNKKCKRLVSNHYEKILFLIFIILFTFMCVFLCEFMRTKNMQEYPQRPKAGIRFPGAGGTGHYHPRLVLGTESKPSLRVARVTLNY